MLDMVAALAFGIISANGSPLQIIHAGEGSEAVQMLPWSLIPTVLVPMYLIVHGIIFAKLAQADKRVPGCSLALRCTYVSALHAPLWMTGSVCSVVVNILY